MVEDAPNEYSTCSGMVLMAVVVMVVFDFIVDTVDIKIGLNRAWNCDSIEVHK